MVLRITTLQVDPAKVEEVLQLIETSVVPAAHQQPDFKQFTVAADRANATVKAIGLWATARTSPQVTRAGTTRSRSGKYARICLLRRSAKSMR